MNRRQLSQELECPVCLQLPRNPPIFQCENGHLICCDCHPKLNSKCPQGRCQLSKQRSLLAEILLEKSNLPRPCKYSSAGCLHEEEIQELSKHELDCNFRMVHCPDPECPEKPLEKDILPHLIKEHLVLPEEMEKNSNLDKCIWILEDHDYIQRSGDRTWPLSPFKCENVTFFSVLMKSCHDHLWYAWIYTLGSSKTASQFRCQVHLQSFKDPEESLTYKGKPHSVDKSGQEVILDGALVMSDQMVKNMVKEMNNEQKLESEQHQVKFLLSIDYIVEKIE